MKCIIVDDEPLAREGMDLNIRELPFLELIGQFGNAISANSFLQSNEVDLIFLDIQMPGISGLDWLRSLRTKPLVILTTAFPEFALEGFELDVLDYLVKPVRMERFIAAVNKAKSLFDLRKNAGSTAALLGPDFVFVKSDRQYIKVLLDDILFVKGLKDYVLIYTRQGRIPTSLNIKNIYQQLPVKQFARVNKSYIVNIRHISRIDQDNILVHDTEIPLGRTFRDEFIENYVKNNLINKK